MKSEKRIFYRKLWGLILPITIQNLMTALVSASDAFMLGFVNQTSLSAVSLATQVQFVHNLFMLALTIGRSTGAKAIRIQLRRSWRLFLRFPWQFRLYFLQLQCFSPEVL